MSTYRVTLSLCAALTGLLAIPAAGQAEVDFGLQAERLGRQTLSQPEVMRMREGGVDLIRTPLEWEEIQRSGPGQDYDFSNFDRLIEWATEGDLPQLEILPTLIGSPAWVTGAKTNNYPPRTKADLNHWTRFVEAVVTRYGANGPIDAWQVWNEPNLPTFWGVRKPEPKEYADFLKLTDKAINVGDRSATTVLAGMPQREDAPKPQIEYLEPFYKIKNVERYFDVLATHPFANNEKAVIAAVEDVREVMDDAKDKRTPIWVTETGFASAGPPHPFRRSPSQQASALREVFTTFSKQERKLDIEKAIWYSWRDSDTDPPAAASNDRWQTYAGLFTFDGEPKPAWTAFVELTGGDPGVGAVAVP